jgi:hypothetical protein
MRILAAGGLTFNGDTAAANALDDYEEGTWTPVVGGATSGTKTMGSGNSGFYTKIGNMVTVSGTIHVTGSETLVGAIIILNLPYVCQATANHRSAGAVGTNGIFTCAADYRLSYVVDPGANYIWVIQAKDEATITYAHNPAVGAGISYGFEITYRM